MQLEPRQRPDQVLRVTPKLITSSAILQLSLDELERAVSSEQVENPALEVDEHPICHFCGTRMYGQKCSACGQSAQLTLTAAEVSINYEIPVDRLGSTHQQLYDFDNYGFAEIDHDDEFDMLASIPTGETLVEILLRQLEALVPPEDQPVAEQLVGNLNERGYLEISLDEIASHLQVPIERVEYVLSQLHTLEPLGIGARNLRECLLIQLEALSEQETPHPLAFTLIDCYLERLGRSQFAEIARELKVPEQEVRQAGLYIRSSLHPFPAHTYRADTQIPSYTRLGSDATYVRPDVIIRNGEAGFEVELIEEKRYSFSISTTAFVPSFGSSSAVSGMISPEVQRYMQHHSERARFFIDCVHRRWRTLKRVAELVVDYQ